jgi:hypothetical protein
MPDGMVLGVVSFMARLRGQNLNPATLYYLSLAQIFCLSLVARFRLFY